VHRIQDPRFRTFAIGGIRSAHVGRQNHDPKKRIEQLPLHHIVQEVNLGHHLLRTDWAPVTAMSALVSTTRVPSSSLEEPRRPSKGVMIRVRGFQAEDR